MSFPQGSANKTIGRINVGQSLARTESLKAPRIQTKDTNDAARITLGSDEAPTSVSTPAQEPRAYVSRSVAQGIYTKQQNREDPLKPQARQAEAEPPVTSAIDAAMSEAATPSMATLLVDDDYYDDSFKPRGPSEEVVQLARKYVTVFEPQDSEEKLEKKIVEVAKFYSAPERIGRLEALIAAFEGGG